MTAHKPKKSHPWAVWSPGALAKKQIPHRADKQLDVRTRQMRTVK